MKKILAMVLCALMVLSMAACTPNGGNETTTTGTQIVVPGSALEMMEGIWSNYTEEDKALFPYYGGDPDNAVDNAPGAFSLADPEVVTSMLLIPADQISVVTEAASMANMMNGNFFTVCVVRLQEGTDAGVFADAIRDAIQGNRWMCGFPEKLFVYTLGDFVIFGYGLNDAVSPFQLHLYEAYPDVTNVYDEALG